MVHLENEGVGRERIAVRSLTYKVRTTVRAREYPEAGDSVPVAPWTVARLHRYTLVCRPCRRMKQLIGSGLGT